MIKYYSQTAKRLLAWLRLRERKVRAA